MKQMQALFDEEPSQIGIRRSIERRLSEIPDLLEGWQVAIVTALRVEVIVQQECSSH
jgi:hypothetical protein